MHCKRLFYLCKFNNIKLVMNIAFLLSASFAYIVLKSNVYRYSV